MSLRVIADAKNAVKGLTDTGTAIGKLGQFAKRGTLAVAGVATAIGGMAIKGGINRYLATEDAIKAMEGLKIPAQDAARIVNEQVRPAVRGTLFSTGEAANVAAGAMASGIDQGQALTNYLKLTADAATQAKVDFNSMGQMMNKVQGEGKLTGEVMAQMADNGLYVLPMLADEYGVTQEAMRKMVSAGEVDAARFQKVLENNIGGAAQKGADTTRGAWTNMISSFSIAGEKLVSGVMPAVKDSFNGIQSAVEAIQPYAEQAGEWLGTKIPVAVEAVSTALSNLGGAGDGIGTVLAAFSPLMLIVEAITPLLPEMGAAFMTIVQAVMSVGQALMPVVGTLRDILIPIITTIISTVLPPLIGAFQQVAGAVVPFVEMLAGMLVPVLQFLGPILLGLAEMILNNVVGAFQGIINVLTGVIDFVTSVFTGNWQGAWEAVKQIIRGAFQFILNFIQLTLLGGVTRVIRGAVAGFRGLFSGGFNAIRNIVSTAFNAIRQIAATIMAAFVNLLRGRIRSAIALFTRIPGQIKSALGNLGNLLKGAGKAIIDGFVGGLKRAWEAGKKFVSGIGNWIKDNKGPLSYDRKLLQPAGKAIMEGLRTSMQGQIPQLKRTLGTVTDEIAGLEASPRVQLQAERRSQHQQAGRRAGNNITIEVNFNGLVTDRVGTAREIRRVLHEYDVLVGADG
ncbi:MAG TPA: tape measure protein [Guyparkeria sp.]|nr:tape measure protein [Guyparkeria sp.]